MRKCSDQDVLLKSAEAEERQKQKLTSLKDFRKRFNEYQRAKRGEDIRPNSVSRPYVEVFRQPKRKRRT